MANSINNYARFYMLLSRLQYDGDKNDLKEDLVHTYTGGRTVHVSDMTPIEYKACCDGMEKYSGFRDDLKKWRSCCLKKMQQLGIDTTDWNRVNAFCKDTRIAGKPFASLYVKDLMKLDIKLRSIQHHGGLKNASRPKPEPKPEPGTKMVGVYIPYNAVQN